MRAVQLLNAMYESEDTYEVDHRKAQMDAIEAVAQMLGVSRTKLIKTHGVLEAFKVLREWIDSHGTHIKGDVYTTSIPQGGLIQLYADIVKRYVSHAFAGESIKKKKRA